MKKESTSKRLAKNTAYMYIRMAILTVITLYTSRVVLQQLGVDDFGIYGVVGSVVAMFSSLRGLFATSTQRFVFVNYLVKRFTRKWLVVGCFGVFFLLQILSYVASVRTDSGRGASMESVKIENNGAVDAVAEMGGTMFCLIKTMNLVPECQSYRYGRSYMYAFTSIIPNLGFWDIHPAKKEANLSDWLTDSLGLDYGTGFSMCAEAYANFGYLCFLAFIFWGWFLANIFGKIEISAQTQNYALMAFLLILFWFFLTLPRNNFINLIRPFFFIAGPIYLYCTKQKMKKNLI